MDKKTTLSYVGSMQQLASVRPIIFQEGRASNLPAYSVKNGIIAFDVLCGKSLDLADFTFKGVNLNFLSKPGLMGRNHFDTNGDEALRSIMGGMFFTCGLENICAPCTDGGKNYPMHGRIRTTPAEHVSADARWDGDTYKITIQGEMREAELFGENMVLRRHIETEYGKQSVQIIDEITNESFRDEPMMLLYHFNIGYPFLTERCSLIIPTQEVLARDEVSLNQISNWNKMGQPKVDEPEYVYIHDLASDAKGSTFVAVWNPDLEVGLKLSFSQKFLPYFMQWKSTAAGDYVLGLEPSNSSVYGRLHHQKECNLNKLKSFETQKIKLQIDLFDQVSEFEKLQNESEKLIKKEKIK